MNRGLIIRRMAAATILAGSILIPAMTTAASATVLGTGAASTDSAMSVDLSIGLGGVSLLAQGAAVAVPVRVVA
jgi:hypothetical protein